MSLRTAPLLLKSGSGGDGVHATRTYRPGDIVLDFAEVEWRVRRDRVTVQHPTGGHMYHPTLAAVGHSCDPNCQVDLAGRVLVALKTIGAGDEVTFDYKATESHLAFPFECGCGATACRGWIA
jgi:tyrocidine synthetase-3